MKLKVTHGELNECITNAVKRFLNEGRTKRSTKRDENEDSGLKRPSRKNDRKYNRWEENEDGLYESVIDDYKDDYGNYDRDEDDETPESITDIETFNSILDDESTVDDVDDEEMSYSSPSYDDVEEPLKKVVAVKTDIQPHEKEWIELITSNFDSAVINKHTLKGEDGRDRTYIGFDIPEGTEDEFVEFLQDNDVEVFDIEKLC